MPIIISIFKLSLKFFYFFFKLFPINTNKIAFFSRQSNVPSLDILMIKEELEKRNRNIKCVILTKRIGKKLSEKVGYYFYTLRQMYHLATSKVCVVDSYVIPVSVLNHKKDLVIIQIWHAMGAIKKFGFQCLDKPGGHKGDFAMQMRMHKNYDYVISGSDTMIPYFSEAFNVVKDKFISLGLPRMDYLINDSRKIKKDIHKKYPNINSKKVILYVPTFRKNKNNKVDDLINIIDLDKYNLIIKSHPNKKINITDERIYTCREFSSLALLTIADYIITDYSAISIEASVLNKPIYFYVYDYDEYISDTGVNIDLYKEMPNCVFETADKLYTSITKKKYNFDQLNKFRDKYVSNRNGDSTAKIVDLIIERGIKSEK